MNQYGNVAWPLIFVAFGYVLGTTLIGSLMIVQRLKASIDSKRLKKGIGIVGIILNFVLGVGGFVALAGLFGSTFREHATTSNSVLMLFTLTAVILGLAKILVDTSFFKQE